MEWISGLAGKAEEVLNNIDRGTAAVLKKEDGKRGVQASDLLEVRSLPLDSSLTVEEFLKDETKYSDPKMDFQKMSSFPNTIMNSTSITSAFVDKPMTLQSESIAWLDSASENSVKTENLSDYNTQCNDSHLNEENNAYKVIDETKNASDDPNQFIEIIDESSMKNLSPAKNDNIKSIDKDKEWRIEYSKKIESLEDQISLLTSERTRFIREISDLSSTLEKTRLELSSIESELDQHRARALKTLQERDKLIAELRNNSEAELEDSSVLVELNQLRQERDTLRDENCEIREKLRLSRQEAIDADLNAEKVRQRASEASTQAREAVAAERRRRLDVEEDIKFRNEEVKSLRDELAHRHNTFTAKLQKQESEISRLRSQLSVVATPNSEVETRLSSLTRTLVLKQQELEHLTTERNALRLQLEKLEHEYQNWRKNLPFNNINDTDDAKALLPSFLIESPFDTGVARRVKRAYSSLDAVGVRIGLFLRRYPLARILVLIYMALLQFWVLIVLFSESPEVH
ncbi:PREDICTED: golgin-84 [Ceratosolen solmsi marchali]|uniref:Golgin-84 n=1 Tax=Ceratosolen solmsi marchali TaxID=326594 RepID=A0AAJ6YXN8_9HYME|nr:PREDICTED: golgin-84 [Ceratosolen solmsi marchali]